jgi:N-acetylmuramoyl-L-alanine amidase
MLFWIPVFTGMTAFENFPSLKVRGGERMKFKLHYQQVILISVMLFFTLSFSVEGSVTLKSVNGSVKIETISSDSFILLPLHEVVSYYEADFQWDAIHEQMKLLKDNVNIRLTLGNPHILVNDCKLKLLSAPPSIHQGMVVLSPQDTVSILSDLIPSMVFAYNESETTITAEKNSNYESAEPSSAKPKSAFDVNYLDDESKFPGNFDLKTVVIDSGHGGHDPGASRAGVREKDIVLDVSSRLAELLKTKTSLQIVMTRDTDVFIPLPQRTSIANRYSPDSTLFVCIHINASPSKTGGGGTETYIFDLEATDKEANALAKRENEGEPMDLTIILSHLYHVGTEPYSLDIAKRVQKTVTSQLGLDNRGVRRAPFYVLAGTKMPAILVELAYVSNPSEREKLSNPSFRQQAAEALFGSIMGFKGAIDKSLAKAKPN